MQKYSKAVAAFLAGAVGLAVALGMPAGLISQETIQAVAVVIGTLLVYLVPNRE